jgi:dTDP-4-dehydrorhamnose reductase
MNKTVVLGGTGLLGSELKKVDSSLICVGSEVDISNYQILTNYLEGVDPDIIINCAALKSEIVDIKRLESIDVNIIGAANVAKYCLIRKKRLCFISTDYVYPGTKGNYSENDTILPNNLYAWSKLSGESSTLLVENSIIIRTSFGQTVFPYEFAFENLFTSKDYVDLIAPLILKVVKSEICGVINVGTERKSIHEYAKRRNKVESRSLSSKKDYSLDLKKLSNIL